ncbi:FAD-dependent monooxygenase [Nonomuraea sp. NPDC046570]|uniref:FAD-dependent monooxygenase n=1 Tax=Nonomuraea sp. NPDC046570 TaxID=3155255 RepID=UPI0033C12166
MDVTEVEVLVVGAGPVGLSTALMLGRFGIKTRVVERRVSTSTHPKAHVINPRTMELFRQWGIADRIRAAALPLEHGIGVGWMTRMTGIELGSIVASDDPGELAKMLADSSEGIVSCPQDEIEPILLEAVRALGVDVSFDAELTGIAQDSAGVDVTVRRTGESAESSMRARYVVAADGARSPVRELLGIRSDEIAPVGHMINAHFQADLTHLTRDRPYVVWWIINLRTQGAFIALNGSDRWTYNFAFDPARESAGDFPPERCAEIIREAAGDPDLTIDVRSVLPWKLEIAIAERFRDGRVFLAGDAAHRFPPTGGFGMNTGVQDAHNLAWKLAAVLRGQAGERLLATYEEERVPVARFNATQSMRNAEKMAQTGALLTDPQALSAIEEPAGGELRTRLAAAIPAQKEHFFFQGQTFGHVYASAAVIDDGSQAPRSTIGEYRMSARPGALAPHAWFRTADGARVATVDLMRDGFLVLTGPHGQPWIDAARDVGREFGLAIAAYRVGPDGDLQDEDDAWQQVWGVGPRGCVVVRPDGHVALRHPDLDADLASVLHNLLARHETGARSFTSAENRP